MKLRIKNTGQVYDFERHIGEALLATEAVEHYIPPAPEQPKPNTTWSIRNTVLKDSGDGFWPPEIVGRCKTCSSNCQLTGPTVHLTQLFTHNCPGIGQKACGVSEPVPEHIRKLYEIQLRRIPKSREKSALDEAREDIKRFAVRAI